MRAISLLYGISALAVLATCEGFATARFISQTNQSANTALYRPGGRYKNKLEIQHPFLRSGPKGTGGKLPRLNPAPHSAVGEHPFLLEPHGVLHTPLELAGVGSHLKKK